MGLPDQKMTTKIVLDRPDNLHRLPTQRVKRIGDHRVISQTPGIVTLLPTRAARPGAASRR